MKRLVIITITLVIGLFISYTLVFYNGFYLPDIFSRESKEIFTCDKEKIYKVTAGGNKREFVIKGVNVDNFIPGHNPSEHAVDYDTWTRWFSQMSDMGANTIRITTIYNDVFYNALYDYNKKHSEKLYLLQGIQVSEYANNNSRDAYDDKFYNELIKQGETAVDIIHGRRNVVGNKTRGDGRYRKDISKWVVGYLVGSEWNEATIEYTNNKGTHTESYSGKYLSTTEGSDAFETELCRIMDDIVKYEASKYKQKRLISFINDPLYDPFIYNEGYDLLYGKYAQVDLEHIASKNYNGLFAAYSAYSLCDNYSMALSARTKAKISDKSWLFDTEGYLNGYLNIVNEYHTHPVVVTSFECSTARGVTTQDEPMDEIAQGNFLADSYRHIIDAGCSGAFIEGWQDSWTRRSYNTSYALEFAQGQNWMDPQTAAQSKGILEFVPQNIYQNVNIDGSFKDFSEAPTLFSEGGYEVKYSYNTTYLYFYIKGVTEDKRSYLAFDITDNSGAKSMNGYEITFKKPVDFVLEINGRENTALMVQKRYDSLRENYLEVLTGEDPYENPPETDTADFDIVGMLRQPQVKLKNIIEIDELLEENRSEKFESGRLHYGNGNPKSDEYDSLSDFCFGDDGVELRIPWTLLNFSDPAAKYIHSDYYENYGRENKKIKSIFIGIGDDDKNNIAFTKMSLPDFGTRVKYKERLKASYKIIQDAWKE